MKSLLVSVVATVVLVGCKSFSIHQAVFDGNIGAVKQHLDAGAEVDAKDDKFVGTFLHWATAGGQKEIVELLIAKGANVNSADGDGDTPLHLAGSTTASTEIAELLISKGADVNAMNLSPPGRRIGGMTPLDMATLGNRTEIAALLRKHGGKTAKELGMSYLTTDSILRKHNGKTGEELKAEGK
jgi:ankyrin repeat protein